MRSSVRKAVTDDPILQVADRMAGRLRQAFLDAVAAAGNSVSIKDLQDAITHGDTNRVLAMLDGNFTGALQGAGLVAGIASLRDAIQAVYAAAAKAAASALPPSVSTAIAFNLLNPASLAWLDSYTMDLIRQASAEQRAAIQQAILRGFQEGRSPAQQAREIRDVIGLTARQEQAIANYRRMLEDGDLNGALERALRDGRYDRSILAAIRNGRGLDQARIDRMVERYRERYLALRAETIARTESIRAANAGQRALWLQAREQGLLPDGVKREWITSGDERTCAVCADLDGTQVGIDEEFAPGIMNPGDAHPSDRCGQKLAFPKAAEREMEEAA